VFTRCRTTVELAQQVGVRLDDRLVQRDKTGDKLVAKDPAAFKTYVEGSAKALDKVPAAQWEPATLEAALKSLADSMGVKPGDLFQAIRVALTGGTASEPAHELIWAVGRTRTLHRLARALA
jgi:glutamyl-tRNA synthetase